MILHHIGIVVDHLEDAAPLFEVWMRARRIGAIVEDVVQNARIQLYLAAEDSLLELIEPLDNDSISMHQIGDYHLCYTVPDIDIEMRRLHELGAIVSSSIATAPLFNNQRIAFLATHSGQLLELLENPLIPVA